MFSSTSECERISLRFPLTGIWIYSIINSNKYVFLMKTSLLSCFLGVVGRGRLVSRGGLVDRGRGVGGGALVPDIHHVAGVAISSVVGDNLGAAVGEEDTVLAIGGVAITGLVLAELDVALVVIVGINAVLVLVLDGGVLVGLVGGGGSPLLDGVVDRGRGGLVSRGRVGSGLVGRGMGLSVARVLDISDIAGVVISDSVGDSLGAAVGEEDVVLAVGGIAITVLTGAEEDTVVVILGINTVLVGVVGGGLLVGRGGGIGGRGRPLLEGVVGGRGGLVVTSVLDIGNIARVVIGNSVGDSL